MFGGWPEAFTCWLLRHFPHHYHYLQSPLGIPSKVWSAMRGYGQQSVQPCSSTVPSTTGSGRSSMQDQATTTSRVPTGDAERSDDIQS